MVDSSKVRVVCPLVSFLFARLGASLDTSSPFLPLIENFIFEGCGLGVVVGELFPMLSQSINWFRDLIKERERMSEVQFTLGMQTSNFSFFVFNFDFWGLSIHPFFFLFLGFHG